MEKGNVKVTELNKIQCDSGILSVKLIVITPEDESIGDKNEYSIEFNPEFTDEAIEIVRVSTDDKGEIDINVTPRLWPKAEELHHYKIDEHEITEMGHYFEVR